MPQLPFHRPHARLCRGALVVTLSVALWLLPRVVAAQHVSPGEHDALLRRIEQLEAQVRALTERLGMSSGSTTEVSPASAPAAAHAGATSVAPPDDGAGERETEAALHEEMSADGPRMQLRGYADLLYRKGAAFPERGFALGQADTFVTSRLSERIHVLAEAVFEGNENNELAVDLERILLQFAPNDRLHLAVGRYHTAIGFYNTAYHHGAWFQTATSRPRMFAFEDDGGVLPIHNLGVSATGMLASGPLGLRYVAEVGNGRASTPGREPVQNITDENAGVAVNLGVLARPDRWPGLQAGVSVYQDRLTPGGTRIGETIVAAHAVYQAGRVELLNEALLLRHAIEQGAVRTTTGFYSQAGVRAGAYRPYARVDFLNVDAQDPLYRTLGRDAGIAAGLRYDVGTWAALKGQAERWSHRTSTAAYGFEVQLAFAF